MFKVLEPSIQELQNLNYSLIKSSFCIMVLNEKICKNKVFDAFPTLETCGAFLDNR